MTVKVRRIVTGVNANGQAVVIQDGDAPNASSSPEIGIERAQIWATDEAPADLSRDDDPTLRKMGIAPPPGGSVLRVVDFLPNPNAELDNTAFLKTLNLSHAGDGRHPFMHRTKSIDYAIVLDGEIDMLLDEGEVHVRAGDILIQRGTNHAWINRGTKTCRIAFVLIGAKDFPPPDGASSTR